MELVTRTPTFTAAKRHEHKRNPSRRFISCELECSDASSGSAIDRACRNGGHSVVEDGSLPDTGFEINTAPASGDVFCARIEALCAALQSDDADVDSSCGYHVHVDARDFTWWDVRRLVLLYSRIEDALFQVVSPSRRESDYAERCAERYLRMVHAGPRKLKEGFAQAVYKAADKAVLKECRKSKYTEARYAALNLHSWIYRGTIECRLHQGTINADKIIAWALLWAGILDWVNTHSEKDVAALPSDSFAALLALSPTEEVRSWLCERRNHFANK